LGSDVLKIPLLKSATDSSADTLTKIRMSARIVAFIFLNVIYDNDSPLSKLTKVCSPMVFKRYEYHQILLLGEIFEYFYDFGGGMVEDFFGRGDLGLWELEEY
jgi:hypothetical protein